MKKILLLGGSPQQIVAINTAKKLGLYTVLCDYLADNPGRKYADRFYLESTTDKEAILRIAKTEKIDFIVAYASDPAAPTAAYVAEIMGLPTNPYNAVMTLCNKDLFRDYLSSHGFNTPRFKGYESKQDVMKDLHNFTLPIIIKPVDSSGSKGVTVIYDLENVEIAIDFAFSFSRAGRIIVEEYVEKKHEYLIGGDIFVLDGKVIQWGLLNCHRGTSVNPLVPVGKSFPPKLKNEDLNLIKDTLQKLVSSLGIKFGPMNVEIIIDRNNKVFPIDIGPRSGGNMIPDLLGMIFNCDVVEMCIKAAMGNTIDLQFDDGNLYYATYNLNSDVDGEFKGITFSSDIEPFVIRKCIYKSEGDYVHAFNNASDAIGIVFLKFNTSDEMNTFLKDIKMHIRIVLQAHKNT